MSELSIGVVGLGVMGRNLALNLEEHGFSVAVWDAWPDPVTNTVAAVRGKRITGYHDIGEFVQSLDRPRRIILLVKAGEVVDTTIASLEPFLSPGDVLVDGGNERYTNTERRAARLAQKGIRYFGMGVSGGESGARHGPSLMPGGSPEGYQALEPILTKIAAQHVDGPCVTYVGPGGSGHYVKMVHNGIEYADMQLIAEAYDVLKTLGGLSNVQLAAVFDAWNQGELNSYLVEITAHIFRVRDPEGEGELVDQIVDATAQKGTGKWTVEEASELGVPVPTISTSVDARRFRVPVMPACGPRRSSRGRCPTRPLAGIPRSSWKMSGRPSMRPRHVATPRASTCSVGHRRLTDGAFGLERSHASGRVGALFARASSEGSKRRMTGPPTSRTCSWTKRSGMSSRRGRRASAPLCPWPRRQGFRSSGCPHRLATTT